jgi:hypothetical protein
MPASNATVLVNPEETALTRRSPIQRRASA